MRRDPSWLTAAQAAARLGIKPASLYAYVSRGLIPRRRGPDGRTSYFAAADVERLAKRTPHSRLAPTDIVVPTSISLVDGANGRLWYRGVDAIEASEHHSFEQTAEFLWTGRWDAQQPWAADPSTVRAAQRALRALPRNGSALERIGVIVATTAAADPHRTDGTPDGAMRAGRNLLATIVETLPASGGSSSASFAARLWSRMSVTDPSREQLRLLDRTLGLAAEHGVTLSVVAARLAAGGGAGVHPCVASALGPASAVVAASRFDALEELLRDGETSGDVSASVDAFVAREGRVVGVSTDPYPNGDPRARSILDTLAASRHARAKTVDEVATELKRRGRAEPDMSFATSALSFVYSLSPGSSELITVVARIAGWIAHVISEYRQPTPFRPHATYVGTMPLPEQREGRELLHAVMEYLREE